MGYDRARDPQLWDGDNDDDGDEMDGTGIWALSELPAEPLTYTSPGARLLRAVTERARAAGAAGWDPVNGWTDGPVCSIEAPCADCRVLDAEEAEEEI
jgi:hypothetical protein